MKPYFSHSLVLPMEKISPRRRRQNSPQEPSMPSTKGNEKMKQEREKDIISYSTGLCSIDRKKEISKPVNERQSRAKWRTRMRKETHYHHHLPKPAWMYFQGLVMLLTWSFLYSPALSRIVPSSSLIILTVNKTVCICSGLSWQSILNARWHFKSLKALKPPEVIREIILYNPIFTDRKADAKGLYPSVRRKGCNWAFRSQSPISLWELHRFW